MQKFLSLLICMILTLINVCYFSVSADDNSLYNDEFIISHFEDLSNWGIYSPFKNGLNTTNYTPTPTFDGESCQTEMGWCNIKNDTSEDADGSGKSIKIMGDEFNVAVNLPTLNANTEYTLTFKYKPDTKSTVCSENYYFTSRIIKKGTAFATDNMYPTSYIAETEKATQTTDWNELSVSFKTDNTTDYMLEFRFDFEGGYVCFLDDFNLTTKTQSSVPITPSSHFEDLSIWGIYSPFNTNNTSYIPTPTFDGESCQIAMGWCNIKNDTTEDADGSGKSIKIMGNEFNIAVNLPTLKTNTEYTLTFKYKPNVNSTVCSENYYFTSRIIKKGTAFATDNIYPASYIAETEKATETTNWKKLSVSFKTDNTTDYMLEFRFDFGGGYVCFLDDFNLTTESQSSATITTSYNGKAALRTTDQSSTAKNGLRIYNSISKQFLKDNTVLEYGSVVCLEKTLGNAELTLDTEKSVKGIAYNNASQSTPILYDETDEAYIFTAYLTNIPTVRYGENYLVRSYAIDDKENVYYGDTVSVCVFDIAHAIDCGNTADGSAPSDTDIAAFKAFANYDGDYLAYDAWLIANGKTAGELRNNAS